uniref:Uncharacterized protein n=1 Tax=Oryza nivara TaxID=4536 RepID=A0A0E0H6U9_ORYNI
MSERKLLYALRLFSFLYFMFLFMCRRCPDVHRAIRRDTSPFRATDCKGGRLKPRLLPFRGALESRDETRRERH